MRSVPFKVELHGGLSEAHGAVYLDDTVLVLEMQTTVLGLVSQKPEAFHVDISELESVEHRRGLLGDKLTLRTRPLDRIADVPGVAKGALCLRVARKHRDLLDELLVWLDPWVVD